MTAYILLVLLTHTAAYQGKWREHGSGVALQEFTTQAACNDAKIEVLKTVVNATVKCLPKG